MNETRHTPGRWDLELTTRMQLERPYRVRGQPTDGAIIRPTVATVNVEADARRIVACVNACEGLPTETLERGALSNLLDTIERTVECGIIYQGYPDGTTCRDQRDLARDPAARFGDEFRARLLAGEQLCPACVILDALANLKADGA